MKTFLLVLAFIAGFVLSVWLVSTNINTWCWLFLPSTTVLGIIHFSDQDKLKDSSEIYLFLFAVFVNAMTLFGGFMCLFGRRPRTAAPAPPETAF